VLCCYFLDVVFPVITAAANPYWLLLFFLSAPQGIRFSAAPPNRFHSQGISARQGDISPFSTPESHSRTTESRLM
jgi:hypothetical protein